MTGIDEIIDLGDKIINSGLTTDQFVDYKSKVKSVAIILKEKAISENKRVLPVIEDLIANSEEDYKLNILIRIYYFKRYQYRYSVNPWTNKPEHIKLRYVIETKEDLENLQTFLSLEK